jgi:hypothetical protein
MIIILQQFQMTGSEVLMQSTRADYKSFAGVGRER